MTQGNNFSVSFLVDNTPQDAFDAINNVRGWWSQAIEGETNRLGAEFNYHYQDVHRATFKITEFVPNKKVVWHVVKNEFNFVKDKTEWTGNDIVFEITPWDGQTEVRFTQIGLVPDYECYEVCSNAWGTYITSSLRSLITTGQGQPNPIEDVVNKAQQMSAQSFTTSFTVDQSPAEVYEAINNARGWWASDIEGESDKVGAEFVFQYKDLHRSTQKVMELVPNKKVVWHVTDSYLSFIQDKHEWTGSDIVFDIREKDGKTELVFTHVGLIPAHECYGDCSEGWGFCVNRSLYDLITQGKGQPSLTKQQDEQATSL